MRTLTFSGGASADTLNWRFVSELLALAWLDRSGRNRKSHLFVFGRQSRFDVPEGRADTLGAVAHQPLDLVSPFADVEPALEVRIPFGFFFDGWNFDPVNEINGEP